MTSRGAALAGAHELRMVNARTILRLCQVPERLTTTEWATKYRELPKTSSSPGRYRVETVPYHRRAQDLMTDITVSLVVLAWATQTGKSTCIENALGLRMHLRPAPMLVLRPKIEDAEAWSKERLEPMLAATPVLAQRVNRAKSTMRFKDFPGGYLFIPSAQSATELASRSAPDLFVDEADRMELIPGEGNPIAIIQRRNSASDLGTTVITSTPRDAETTLIWPYLEGGTYELYEVPCPHCDHRQPFEWGTRSRDHGLRWTYGQPRTTAHYLCRSCQTAIDERDKPDMLLAGDWRATQPTHEYPSLHLNGLYSPFAKSNWGVLASEWETSQGKPADLQVFVNTRLAEPWEEPAEAVDETTLNARRDFSLEEGLVPDGVGVLSAGADVQELRIVAWVWGWGEGLESWPIASVQIPGDTSEEPSVAGSVWQRLDEFLAQEFRHVSGRIMRVRTAFVDSGYQAKKVYDFTRPRVRRKIFASKGVGGDHTPALGKPSAQGRPPTILYPVGVDALKTEFLRSQVHIREPGAGYVHVPGWVTDDQIAQLLNEKRKSRVVRGHVVREWVKRHPSLPNDDLDCRVYARAAVESMGPKVKDALGTLAAKWSVRVDAPDAAPPAEGDAAPDEEGVAPASARQTPRRAPTARPSWVRGSWFRGR